MVEGGFECSLVGEPDDGLVCPICLLPCRKPHLISCCGKKACYYCISKVQEDGQLCPCCRSEEFETMIDRDVERRVLSLKVYCANKEGGCGWTGELRHLETHTNSCLFSFSSCKYQCGLHCCRSELYIHERDNCELRPEVLLQEIIDTLKIDLNELKKKYQQQENEVADQYETIRQLKIKVKRQESLIDEHEEQSRIVLKANDDINEKLHKQEVKNVKLVSRVEFLEGELLKYKKRVKTIRSEIMAVLRKDDHDDEEDDSDQKNDAENDIIFCNEPLEDDLYEILKPHAADLDDDNVVIEKPKLIPELPTFNKHLYEHINIIQLEGGNTVNTAHTWDHWDHQENRTVVVQEDVDEDEYLSDIDIYER